MAGGKIQGIRAGMGASRPHKLTSLATPGAGNRRLALRLSSAVSYAHRGFAWDSEVVLRDDLMTIAQDLHVFGNQALKYSCLKGMLRIFPIWATYLAP